MQIIMHKCYLCMWLSKLMQKSFSVGDSITDRGKLFHNLITDGKKMKFVRANLCTKLCVVSSSK